MPDTENTVADRIIGLGNQPTEGPKTYHFAVSKGVLSRSNTSSRQIPSEHSIIPRVTTNSFLCGRRISYLFKMLRNVDGMFT